MSCLSVSGNDAVVGFDLGPLSTISGILVEVEDNGPPGSDPPDTLNPSPVDDPSSCTPPGLPSPPFEVVEGDVTVTDAPPAPTRKNDCEKGGYERFGFKNQGQCVAFVQRGPK